MEHEAIKRMRLDFPFIYAEFEDGKKFRYNINEMIPERKEYEKLKDVNFFNSAKLLPGNDAIAWDDFIDMPTSGIAEFGEEVEEF